MTLMSCGRDHQTLHEAVESVGLKECGLMSREWTMCASGMVCVRTPQQETALTLHPTRVGSSLTQARDAASPARTTAHRHRPHG